MTCRYCGATFAAKVLEWQDDLSLPTAQDVYPHFFSDTSIFVEKTEQIAAIPPSPEIDFHPGENVPEQSSTHTHEHGVAARAAASVDQYEDVEITEDPLIAPRSAETDEILEQVAEADNQKDEPASVVADMPQLQEEPAPEPELSDIQSQPAEPVKPVELTKPQDEPELQKAISEAAAEAQHIVDKDVKENIIEFPKFVKDPGLDVLQESAREAIIDTATTDELLEEENFSATAETFHTSKLIIEEQELLQRVEANDRTIRKFNHMVYVWISLIAIAIAIMVGLVWMILMAGRSNGSSKAMSDLNASIRSEVEVKFDDSPQLRQAEVAPPVEENSIAELVSLAQPAEPQPLAAATSVASAAPTNPARKSPVESPMPAELDSSRVEITLINAEGRVLNLASRSYNKLVSGGEIVFDVSELQATDKSDALKVNPVGPVAPLAMKILSMSRWGGLPGAAGNTGASTGLVYVWCEFYGNDGLHTGSSRGVLDAGSLSLRPGGAATYKMFFQPGRLHSNTVPDEMMFHTAASQGGVAMITDRDTAFLGMPVFFK